MEKSHSFIFIYKNEDMESYKAIDENIETIEDISKPNDDKFNQVIQKFYENTLINDDMLQFFFDAAKNSIGLENIVDTEFKYDYFNLDNIQKMLKYKYIKVINVEHVKFIIY